MGVVVAWVVMTGVVATVVVATVVVATVVVTTVAAMAVVGCGVQNEAGGEGGVTGTFLRCHERCRASHRARGF